MATKSIKQAYFGFLLSVFAAGRLKDRARPLADYAVANIILMTMLVEFFLVSIEFLLRLLIPELNEIPTPPALYYLFAGGGAIANLIVVYGAYGIAKFESALFQLDAADIERSANAWLKFSLFAIMLFLLSLFGRIYWSR